MPRKSVDTVTFDLFEQVLKDAESFKTCKNVPLRGLFILDKQMHMQVQPSKFMMNSTIIYDIFMRGDILAVNLHTNKLVTLKKDALVTHVTAPDISMIAIKSGE